MIGARQRRRALRDVEGHHVGVRGIALERGGTLGEPGFQDRPVIERRLQRGRDSRDELAMRHGAIDDDQAPVAIAAPECRQLHLLLFMGFFQLSTYPFHSTCAADGAISSASRVSIITAYSFVAGFDC